MINHAVQEAGIAANDATCNAGGDPPGLLASAEELWADLRAIAQGHLRLAALEAQHAGQCLVWILVLAILVGGLVLGAWTSTIAALVMGLSAVGVPPVAAALLVAVLHIIAAGVVSRAIQRRVRALGFPATVRSFETGNGVARTTRGGWDVAGHP